MCYVIYLSLISLLLIYSDYKLEQYALSVSAEEGQWILTALGWEILPSLWPVLLLSMVLASAATLLVVTRVKPLAGDITTSVRSRSGD
jgi:hypothetical protein